MQSGLITGSQVIPQLGMQQGQFGSMLHQGATSRGVLPQGTTGNLQVGGMLPQGMPSIPQVRGMLHQAVPSNVQVRGMLPQGESSTHNITLDEGEEEDDDGSQDVVMGETADE